MEIQNVRTDNLPARLKEEFEVPHKETFVAVEAVRCSFAARAKQVGEGHARLSDHEYKIVTKDGTKLTLTEPLRDRWNIKVTKR